MKTHTHTPSRLVDTRPPKPFVSDRATTANIHTLPRTSVRRRRVVGDASGDWTRGVSLHRTAVQATVSGLAVELIMARYHRYQPTSHLRELRVRQKHSNEYPSAVGYRGDMSIDE